MNEIETFYRTTKLSDGLIGLRNAVDVALIIAQAALHNRHSRGCHYREDVVAVEGDRLDLIDRAVFLYIHNQVKIRSL